MLFFSYPSDLMKSTVVDESLSSTQQLFCSGENQLVTIRIFMSWPCKSNNDVHYTSWTPRISVCWHCSIMFSFMMWTSSSHLTLNSWLPSVGWVGIQCPPPHCSSHLTLDDQCGWGVLIIIAHLTNQVDCSSAVKHTGYHQREWLS